MSDSSAVPNGTSVTDHDAAIAYAWQVVREVDARLTEPLHAAYVIGSLAFGDYALGVSDIDLALVSSAPPGEDEREQILERLEELLRDSPAPGLGMVLYRGPQVPVDGAIPFDLDVAGGPDLPLSVVDGTGAQPAHWYVIDVSMARQHALRLSGPEAPQVFGEPDRAHVLRAIERSLWWQGGDGSAPGDTVLNACRSWSYASEGLWSSKTEAAAWARRRVEARQEAVHDPPADSAAIIDAALAARGRRGAAPSARDMRRFVGWVLQVVDAAGRREVKPAA
jgi:predicted nucleotidyltransferase